MKLDIFRGLLEGLVRGLSNLYIISCIPLISKEKVPTIVSTLVSFWERNSLGNLVHDNVKLLSPVSYEQLGTKLGLVLCRWSSTLTQLEMVYILGVLDREKRYLFWAHQQCREELAVSCRIQVGEGQLLIRFFSLTTFYKKIVSPLLFRLYLSILPFSLFTRLIDILISCADLLHS